MTRETWNVSGWMYEAAVSMLADLWTWGSMDAMPARERALLELVAEVQE